MRGCGLLHSVVGSRPGVYVLLLHVHARVEVVLGGVRVSVEPGCYAYVGSAGRGLASRVCRHLGRPRRLHWHIDRLTSLETVEPVCVAYVTGVYGLGYESCTAGRLASRYPYVPGFGSTDDPRSPSHLLGPSPLRNLAVDSIEALKTCTSSRSYGLLCLSREG